MLFLVLPTLLALAGILGYQYWRFANRRFLELSRVMPGPPTVPILGNALIMVASQEEQLSVINKVVQTYGEHVRLWYGPDLNVLVSNPTDIKTILSSNKASQKGPTYKIMQTMVGPGLLAGGPTWRHHRKIAKQSFTKKCIQNYRTVFNAEARNLVNVFRSKNPDQTFDVYHDVVWCTTQSVCQTVIGLSKSESESIEKLKEFLAVSQKIYSLVFKKMTHWWRQVPLLFWLLGEQREEETYFKDIDAMTSDIVSRRKAFLKRYGLVDDDKRGTVDRFLMCEDVTEQEVKWETFTSFTASQEATAKVTSAILLFLACLPDWQNKVFEEIIEVFGTDDINVTEERLARLESLDVVYKEALRYLPIAAMIQRKLEEDISIGNGKYTLPAGTSVLIPFHTVHRSPKYWTDPDKVDPARFLPENSKNRNTGTFLPYSLGPMDCLGRFYASALVKTLAVHIVRHFHLETDCRPERLTLSVAVSVKFLEGYNLRARPRDVKRGRELTA